jgi:alpha-glucosidase
VLDEYPEAVAIGEVWVDNDERFSRYVRPDELHLAFNFRLVQADFDADSIRAAIDHSVAAVGRVGATPTWTLSNHDVDREVTRYGDGRVGRDRARAMALLKLALPGVVFLYNGSELGLPNAELPDEALRDPMWERSGHTERGRDACRVPIPWEGTRAPFGFTSDVTEPWLPMPTDWSALTVEAQLEDLASTLSLYRSALELRLVRSEFSGDTIEWFASPASGLAFRRGGGLICALNASDYPIALPPGLVLLSSAPLTDGQLPPNAAAWLV